MLAGRPDPAKARGDGARVRLYSTGSPRSGVRIPGFMRQRRTLYAYWRFGRFLAREFRWPVGIFAALVLLGGLGLWLSYPVEEEGRPIGYARACYAVYCLIFFEAGVVSFPEKAWYLEPFFFIVPIIGLGAVADSLVRLGYFIFSSKQKLPEWHRMNASAMRNHVVLVGLGKVGYRILQELLALKEEVVVIERNGGSPFVVEMRDAGVTLIVGEARLRKTLEEANVLHARAVILATDDDLANLDAALTAREIRPDIRVVMRLFDDTLATKVATAFNLPAISTSSVSAPAFIAAATGRAVYHSFQLGNQRLHIADFVLIPGSRLCGRTVGDIQGDNGVNVVMHMANGHTDVNPAHSILLKEGDHMMVIAPLDQIRRLQEMNT